MDHSHPATLESIPNSIIQPSVPRPLKKLYWGEPMALGITQILIGILETAFGVVIVMADQYMNRHYHLVKHILTPYWIGILYLISGSLSVAVAKKPEIPLAKGMLGMNVVSALAAGIAIMMLSVSIPHRTYVSGSNIPAKVHQELVTIPYVQQSYMTAVLLVFSILEFIIAIVSAAFGCATLCQSPFSETTVVIFQNTPQEAPPAVLTPVKEDEALPPSSGTTTTLCSSLEKGTA